ncbi:MAG: hypothetical protein AAFW46_04155 [Pseudomonadota bacterium]
MSFTKDWALKLALSALASTALLGSDHGAVAWAETIDCAAPRCEARLSATCLQRVGAGSLAAGDACEAEQEAYVACLTAVAEQCGAAPSASVGTGVCDAEDARQLWPDLRGSRSVAALEAFAEDCAGTPQATQARLRVEQLRSAGASPSAAPATPGRAPSTAPTAGHLGVWRYGGKGGLADCADSIEIVEEGERIFAFLTDARDVRTEVGARDFKRREHAWLEEPQGRGLKWTGDALQLLNPMGSCTFVR